VIAIEFNKPELERAASQNQTGIWDFIVTHAKGKVLPNGKELIFDKEGPWKEAREQAEVVARNYGCVDGVDSMVVVNFTPARSGAQ
jgi:hypothetical protein